MPSLDKRVADVEIRVDNHAASVSALREDVQGIKRQIESLDQKTDRLFHGLDAKIDGVGARLDAKIDGMSARLDAKIDGNGARLDARIDSLDAKISRQFTWLVGIQVAVLVAIVGALLRR